MCLMLYQSFLNLVDTRFNSKIKSFRSDNARELAFNELFDEKGILHQYSCVDTFLCRHSTAKFSGREKTSTLAQCGPSSIFSV